MTNEGLQQYAENVFVLKHPLAEHFLTHLRDRRTKSALYRTLTKKISLMLALEASRILETDAIEIPTPLETTTGRVLLDEVVLVPILRAGLGMIEPILDLFPTVRVGYVGMQRNEETAEAHQYYANIPPLRDRFVLVTDPMLATGGSACDVLRLVKAEGPSQVSLLTIVSCPEGIARVRAEHPDVRVFTTAVDRELNSKKYILPGLGDFGDRLYGTEK